MTAAKTVVVIALARQDKTPASHNSEITRSITFVRGRFTDISSKLNTTLRNVFIVQLTNRVL